MTWFQLLLACESGSQPPQQALLVMFPSHVTCLYDIFHCCALIPAFLAVCLLQDALKDEATAAGQSYLSDPSYQDATMMSFADLFKKVGPPWTALHT